MIKSSSVKGRPGTVSPPTRPFQCQWHEGCPKSFNRKSDLQRHYRIHTNERPYACDYKPCEKTFIQRSALTVHRRTHTGDKPHKCPYVGCGKCFSDSSSLARHRRIHTNDKPYICKNSQCRKAFCRKTTMTKHFRKEHPTESMDQEEDAEYSDIEESGDEPSLEHDVDSPNSVEYPFDHPTKSETPANAAASNYSANLWRLPAQTAQRPAHHAVKLERSLSGSSQRSMTDPALNAQMAVGAFGPRSNTLPSNIPRSHSTDMAMWQAQQLESPTSVSTDGDYSMQGVPTPTSTPNHFRSGQTLPIRRPSLQPVHDILLDDPTSATYPQQMTLPSGPQPQYHQPAAHDYHDDMPRTPASGQHLTRFSTSMEETPLHIEAYQVPAPHNQSIYNLPPSVQGVTVYNDPLDPYKDPSKMGDNPWDHMPETALNWIQ